MSEVFFIGGSPCSGKSTIAEMLVRKYELAYFRQDDYLDDYLKRGSDEGHKLFQHVLSLSSEQMWMRDPAEQCAEEFSLYETMFAYSMEDISDLATDRPIIAEGAGFLPHLMKQLPVDESHFVCVVPTRDFQITTYVDREWIHHYLSDCRDQDQAFANWMERDALLGERVLRDAENLGYQHLVVDGSTDVDHNCAWVEDVFDLKNRLFDKV